MTSVTCIHASEIPSQETAGILRDYLALERLSTWRRLLMRRFGILALIAFTVASVFHGLTVYERWVPLTVLLVPPISAWIVELRLSVRLSQRVQALPPPHQEKS